MSESPFLRVANHGPYVCLTLWYEKIVKPCVIQVTYKKSEAALLTSLEAIPCSWATAGM